MAPASRLFLVSVRIIIRMPTRPTKRQSEFDVIEPIGKRVVVRKDDNKRETKSGIVLPDSHEIPVITGRVIAVSKAIENDDDQTIRQYDKVLFDPREAIPVELEHDNRLFVVSIDRVLAIFRRSEQPKSGPPAEGGESEPEAEEL
jgi:chaperonin GroES